MCKCIYVYIRAKNRGGHMDKYSRFPTSRIIFCHFERNIHLVEFANQDHPTNSDSIATSFTGLTDKNSPLFDWASVLPRCWLLKSNLLVILPANLDKMVLCFAESVLKYQCCGGATMALAQHMLQLANYVSAKMETQPPGKFECNFVSETKRSAVTLDSSGLPLIWENQLAWRQVSKSQWIELLEKFKSGIYM